MLTPELVLNYTAQQQIPTAAAHQWFLGLSTEERKATLELLRLFVEQSHPTPALVQDAVATQPAKPFTTPLALLAAHPLRVALQKISALPASEYPNAFKILLAIFSSADTFRREHVCQTGCTHDWHNLPEFPSWKME